jgi:MFS transporter, PPP family, 3-phenylpropionic acid transporter
MDMLTSPIARFSLFSAASNLVIGVQIAFWPLWLTARGLTALEIGILAGAALWIRLAVNPLVGVLADSGDVRRIMLALAAGGLIGYALFIPAYGLWPLLLISTASSACFAALTPLADNAVLQARIDYGRMRIWGSLTFLLITLLIGRLLVNAPPDTLLALLILAGVAVLASTWALPTAPAPVSGHAGGAWRTLLRPRHVLFLASAALIQASHTVYNNFSTLYWQSLGFDTDTIGWLWAEGVIAEIALFYYGRALLRRLQPAHLMALGGIAGVLRWTVLGTAVSLPALLAVNFMHCFTWAAAHLGAMYYLLRHAPAGQASTALSVYSATQGLGFGLVSLFSGALYEAIGGGAFLAMAAMCAAGALGALVLAFGSRD